MRLLSVREAASLLGVSADTIYGLCSAKRLRHERVGLRHGRIRIPEEAIEEYRRGATVGVEEAVEPPPPPIRLRHVSL
jgi:excisionase family DNA binding protein